MATEKQLPPHETEPLTHPLFFSLSPEQSSPENIQDQIIAHVAEATGQPIDTDQFVNQAYDTWLPLHLPRGLHDPWITSPGGLYSWSPLVAKDLAPNPRLIVTARKSWPKVQEQNIVYPYVTVIGPIGAGKTSLLEALANSSPEPIASVTVFPEQWQKISAHLGAFYESTESLKRSLSIPWE